ncbi:IS element orfA, putative resolvase [Aeropyrum pernix]|uniref:IS element orfA, putative resolvase n=1 Tax=Aeropyrum pernix TaxID=56636 RepID=A0A401H8A4_AERPX|nr:IS607 family transposase [Aeropyrum pernix]GBF08618.1 IS element orfA, putative resolvase [Aeropyrum pernix]
MEKLYKLSEFAKFIGVSRSAVIKWIREGKVRAINIHGRWYVPESELERLIRGFHAGLRRIAIYARVSGNTQKDDLESQITSLEDYVKKHFPQAEYIVVKDIASGLKEDRRGLRSLIEMSRKRQIDAVVVAHKDRLTRFGFTYLKELFEAYGVRVIVAFNEEPKDYYQELIDDLIAIVTSFAGRIYGKRSHKYKKVVRAVEEAVKDP